MGEQAGQGPGAAADIEHAVGAELVNHGHVGVQVAAVGVQRVVDLGKPRLGEDRVNHAPHRRPGRAAIRANIRALSLLASVLGGRPTTYDAAGVVSFLRAGNTSDHNRSS
jgi:hypothetical protein